MIETAALAPGELAFAIAAVFLAGVVRGFTGFALSALIMATLVLLMPPVELIPVCALLELASSLVLMRDGFAAADKRMVLILQTGGLIGVPAGLYLTNTVDPDISRQLALLLIVTLALMQLARIRLPVSGAPLPTFLTGITSGFATGLASIGGMVIALYALARNLSPRVMRGSLILQIFIGGTLGLIWQSLYGMLTPTAFSRAGLLLFPMLAGVFLGRTLFTPAYESYYRPFSLLLLIGLGLAGLARTLL
ncbi:sulfite exporter TauE/SafE family protein [Marimonas lutisalis]|uniref:sulfite exporter TauE/SafE family protein n=1 Tax=Marimonas lutisalis TaxID=2545756 RepID=UPI0010F6AE04|nr:sulfite exporter TauE/SafE family protein [Marimonas lutisalis]